MDDHRPVEEPFGPDEPDFEEESPKSGDAELEDDDDQD